MEGSPHDHLRISDEDRHRVAEVLRSAAGDGRIDLEELDERLEAAYGAKTYGELVPLTSDLPATTAPAAVTPHQGFGRVDATSYDKSLSVMGECKRSGVWQVPAEHTAFTMMGSVVLDLREAQFATREVTINAVAIMAGIDVIVNAHTRVVVDGMGFMGDFSESRPKVDAALTADSPVVRITGLALMGAVNVQRKPMPGEGKKKFLGRPSS